MCFWPAEGSDVEGENFLFVRELVCILQISSCSSSDLFTNSEISFSLASTADRRLIKNERFCSHKADRVLCCVYSERMLSGRENNFLFSLTLRCLSFVKFKFSPLFELIPFQSALCFVRNPNEILLLDFKGPVWNTSNGQWNSRKFADRRGR